MCLVEDALLDIGQVVVPFLLELLQRLGIEFVHRELNQFTLGDWNRFLRSSGWFDRGERDETSTREDEDEHPGTETLLAPITFRSALASWRQVSSSLPCENHRRGAVERLGGLTAGLGRTTGLPVVNGEQALEVRVVYVERIGEVGPHLREDHAVERLVGAGDHGVVGEIPAPLVDEIVDAGELPGGLLVAPEKGTEPVRVRVRPVGHRRDDIIVERDERAATGRGGGVRHGRLYPTGGYRGTDRGEERYG
jgi:hypothetical protein